MTKVPILSEVLGLFCSIATPFADAEKDYAKSRLLSEVGNL